MDGDDEWELSLEELDSLVRDAFEKLAHLRNNPSSSTASFICSASDGILGNADYRNIPCDRVQRSPVKPISMSSSIKVDSSSLGSAVLPPKLKSEASNENKWSANIPKLSVKVFFHSSGSIAAKFPYDEVLINAVRKIPKSTWNAKERSSFHRDCLSNCYMLWMFPISSLPSAEKVLSDVDTVTIEVKTCATLSLEKLVRSAIGAASSLPDLQELYERIPINMEAKVLPFRREGVRFIMQHGGRALLADEMGLGKTLQAIAITACIHESWPVLILTPSSLQLQWASMIQQWLNIPSSDIVVVIADESHFLKNGQAKRTTASLPALKRAQYAELLLCLGQLSSSNR